MPGFLQNPTGFLAPTGFTNYLQQYSGAYPTQRSTGGMFGNKPPNVVGGNLTTRTAAGANPSFPGGMGFTNSPGLSTQEQYGGPLMNALQDLIRGTNVAGGGRPTQPKPPISQFDETQSSGQSQVQGVK